MKRQIRAAVLVLPWLIVFPSTPLVAQENPRSQGDSSSQEDIVLLEKYTMQGTRASLMKARELKQESGILSDTIVAEDIAKFPDLNFAESLQRLPGVAINREAGEGRRVSLRGMGPDFNLNGLHCWRRELECPRDRLLLELTGERIRQPQARLRPVLPLRNDGQVRRRAQAFSNYGHSEATDNLLQPQFPSGAIDANPAAYAEVFRDHKDADWVTVDFNKALEALGVTARSARARGSTRSRR